MSAALKSYVPRPVPSRQLAATARPALVAGSAARRASSIEANRPAPVPSPTVLPDPTQQVWGGPALGVLARLHLLSSVLAAALVILTLVSYGTSVFIGRQLRQANQQLGRLQRSEQQLTTANEVLKNHLAQQVSQPALGFQPPQPGNVIFLKPASPEVASPDDSAAANPSGGPAWLRRLGGDRGLKLPMDVPLGY